MPPECAAYMMNPLVFDATAMTLTATTTGQPPSTTETFTWYYFRDALSPVIILTTTAAVITVTEPGTYRVIAKAGICETPPEEFVYADDCASFDAVISVDGPYIIIEPNRFSTLVWEVDTGGGFVPFPDTSHVIQPTVTGTYQVTVTSGTCEVIRSIPFVVTDCDFTIALALVNGIIESTIVGYTGVDTPTYQWYMDTGSGVVLILGAVDANYEPAEPGNYLVDVTLDACTKRANLVVLGECVAFNPYIEYVKDDGGGDVLIAAGHTGAPGPVTFEWWQIRNSVWTNIGVGGSITTDQEGPTKVIATSEGCVKERFTQACIDPANLEWEEREVAATDGQTVFAEPTYFGDIGIPTNTAGLSRERVDAEWELWKNGARLFFVHIADAVANDRTVWSINGAGAIELQWPASAGDSFVLVRRYIP